MTLEKASNILKGAIKKPNTKDGYLGQAITMGVNSLEAWEKVKAEIKDIKDLYDLGKEDVSTKMFLEGVETVEQIIDKYLQEVST